MSFLNFEANLLSLQELLVIFLASCSVCKIDHILKVKFMLTHSYKFKDIVLFQKVVDMYTSFRDINVVWI